MEFVEIESKIHSHHEKSRDSEKKTSFETKPSSFLISRIFVTPHKSFISSKMISRDHRKRNNVRNVFEKWVRTCVATLKWKNNSHIGSPPILTCNHRSSNKTLIIARSSSRQHHCYTARSIFPQRSKPLCFFNLSDTPIRTFVKLVLYN